MIHDDADIIQGRVLALQLHNMVRSLYNIKAACALE